MKNIFAILFILVLISCKEKSTCKDFSVGNFMLSVDDGDDDFYKVLRTDKYQYEYFANDTNVLNIEWVDDCSYILTFNKVLSNREPTQLEQNINNAGGIIVTKSIIENDTFFYSAKMKEFDLTLYGKLYKID